MREGLVPSFRRSSYFAPTSEANFEKKKGTSNYMILVPVIGLKSLIRVCSWLCRDFKSAALVPSFRSSSYFAATSEANFEKKKGTSNYMILVPLIDLKSLTRVCSRWCKDFKSAPLVSFCSLCRLTVHAGFALDCAYPIFTRRNHKRQGRTPMKAAVLYEVNKPLVIEEVSVNKPGPREVLIRTK